MAGGSLPGSLRYVLLFLVRGSVGHGWGTH